MNRDFDLLCMGRAAVDLYGEQIGSALEDVRTFSRSLGGCPANVAVGAQRQGLSVAMLTRVGDEPLGTFVRQALLREGVDVSQVKTDPDRLTGLVLLSILGPERFPLVFFRERCADMGLIPEDVNEAFVGRCRALLVTGTHLSTEQTRAATWAAVEAAHQHGTKVILDIDYRPVLWGLTGHGEGEERFVESRVVTETLAKLLPRCDLVVGTEEEIRIAGGYADVKEALQAIREVCAAPIVMKEGPRGCSVFEVDSEQSFHGVPVDVLNVLGAGDAFLAGFLRGYLAESSIEAAARYGNACGALVVSRHACAPAMPTRLELDDYLKRRDTVTRIDRDERIQRLHEVTTRRPRPERLAIFAFDHRVWFEEVAARTGASSVGLDRLQRLKTLFVEAAQSVAEQVKDVTACGVIVDGRYGGPALERTSLISALEFVARPVESTGGEGLRFWPEDQPVNPRALETELNAWPADRVVKCLIHHPTAEHVADSQRQALLRLQRICSAQEHDLMLEVLPQSGEARDLPAALKNLYEQGLRPRWWKLPACSGEVFDRIAEVVATEDPHCSGVLILGADMPANELVPQLKELLQHPMCRGFAVGRTLFRGPAEAWLLSQTSDEELKSTVAAAFSETIAATFGEQS